jgi:hypothetical protein
MSRGPVVQSPKPHGNSSSLQRTFIPPAPDSGPPNFFAPDRWTAPVQSSATVAEGVTLPNPAWTKAAPAGPLMSAVKPWERLERELAARDADFTSASREHGEPSAQVAPPVVPLQPGTPMPPAVYSGSHSWAAELFPASPLAASASSWPGSLGRPCLSLPWQERALLSKQDRHDQEL